MQWVLDTNVLLPGLRSREGASFQLLKLVFDGTHTIAISVNLSFEYHEVLLRESASLGLNANEIQTLLTRLCTIGNQVPTGLRDKPLLTDADDEKLVDLALSANADYIVTHNVRHLRDAVGLGIRVIRSGELLRY